MVMISSTSGVKSLGDFVDQIKALLTARPLSVEELCLMYSFKHGVSVNTVLTQLHLPTDFPAFVEKRDDLLLDGSNVMLVGEPSAQIRPFDLVKEVTTIMRDEEEGDNQPVEMKSICTKFFNTFNVSLSSVASQRPLEFFLAHPSVFKVVGRTMVSLVEEESSSTDTSISTNDANTNVDVVVVHEPKIGAPDKFAPTKWATIRIKNSSTPTKVGNDNIATTTTYSKADLMRAAFDIAEKTDKNNNAGVRLPPGLTVAAVPGSVHSSMDASPKKHWSGSNASTDEGSSDEEKVSPDSVYYDLHSKVSSRSFNSRVAQTLALLSDAVENVCFLDVVSVAKCGSAGMGTVINSEGNSSCHAKIVVYVNGLPEDHEHEYMPPMLRALKAVLMTTLPSSLIPNGASMTEDGTAIRFRTRDNLRLDVHIAPVFETHADALIALGNRTPSARKWFAPVFAKELTHFVGKQPGNVKVTIRLLKWWRVQQEWSSELTCPSDDIIHLVAIYSAINTKPSDQQTAIANCMSLFANFNNLRIFWSNYYNREDIWEPLLLQKPLLMDPVNPFMNVADPQIFDSRELREKAATTHFFW